jgi:hypothetical protein
VSAAGRSFSDEAALSLLHVLDKRRTSDDAPEQGGERETERGRQNHLKVSESAAHGGSDTGLRRIIRAAWRRNPERKEVENGEEREGYL